ncbi:MAG: hypothetical protein U0R70_17625 [Solirubrobacteraceae bacterium]
MGWTFLWLMVGLKLPIAALLYIVWWAVKSPPEPASGEGGDGGSKRPHPLPPRPRRPRRGPHGDPAQAPPPRVRTTVARSRDRER